MKIIEALLSVYGETDATVGAMIQVLAAKGFAANDPVDGAFRGLSEGLLLGMGFTVRQVAAIVEAQKNVSQGEQSAEAGWQGVDRQARQQAGAKSGQGVAAAQQRQQRRRQRPAAAHLLPTRVSRA